MKKIQELAGVGRAGLEVLNQMTGRNAVKNYHIDEIEINGTEKKIPRGNKSHLSFLKGDFHDSKFLHTPNLNMKSVML